MLFRFLKSDASPVAEVETGEDIAETARFIEQTLGTNDGYRFALGCPKTLLATCFGVCALEVLGALGSMSAGRREAVAGFIQSCQRKEDGLFRDPLHTDEVLFRLGKFSPQYIEWQESYFAIHALRALGARPEHSLEFVAPWLAADHLDRWLRSLDFENFWLTSNSLMFVMLFFISIEGEKSPAVHRLLDWLDRRQDPETGFWGTDQGASLFNGMAGAFHVYGYYQYLDRPIFHAAAAVRSTLAVQEPTGLFGDAGGGPCEDLDAVDILTKLEPGSAEDEKKVRAALELALAGLRACRLQGGGYAWSSPQPKVKRREMIYSGLDTLKVQSDAGDLWSAWFRPLAIALASERLGEKLAWPVKYRDLPLLGWHRPERS